MWEKVWLFFLLLWLFFYVWLIFFHWFFSFPSSMWSSALMCFKGHHHSFNGYGHALA
ncbi:uncharacterized protein DS421_18g622450 [Arachis hypogaea]|nr:uncharacterized protein DS421_18g622450 [Arachis hypogaea]